MLKKNLFWSRCAAAGFLMICAPLALAEPEATETPAVTTPIAESAAPAEATAPLTSQPLSPLPASSIAPAVSSRLGFDLKIASTLRATDPSKKPATAQVAVAAVVKKPDAPATSGLSEADRKLIAQLEAELDATDSKLTKVNAQLSSGQKQLVRVAGLLESELLQGGPDTRGLHPFVRVAQRYAGTPYVWGGESARGFDCSGFIIRVMRDLGYKALPHSAAEQFRYGIPVATQNLRPGDLVFFANTYKPGISHVGIYIGKGRFIHAASTKEGTIVSSLTGKYRAKYAGARRLVQVRS